MKATLEQAEESLSTTPETKTKFKEKFFNHIDKLAADHDVTVSNTMIKVTYKKALKDQNASDAIGDSDTGKKKSHSIVAEPSSEGSKIPDALSPMHPNEAEKKRKYVNGLNLVPKSNLPEVAVGVPSSEEDGCSSVKNVKTNKFDSVKKFLKGSGKKDKNNETLDEKTLEEVKLKSSNNLESAKCKDTKIGDSKAKNEGGKRLKRKIMLVDPDLPAGWTRFIRIKNKGSAKEQYVVYVVDPQGKRFRYRWKLRKYLKKMKSSLDPDQFFFGVYEKPKTCNSSSTDKDESEWRKEKTIETEAKPYKTSSDPIKSSDKKELLLYDPDLPFGWKRTINSNSANGRKQVHIISPDGTIFRRRYRLQEYLEKHQYTHNLDRFYFGLYPKREESASENISNSKDNSKVKPGPSPMYEDPNLPEGWTRLIRKRSFGESAGRMEVIILSPDGKRLRSKKHLEHYLLQNKLNYKSEDFDFSVFGKSNAKRRSAEADEECEREDADLPLKRRISEKPVPDLNIEDLKEAVITPEGHLINTVNGLMMCSGLSSARNERRQRVPRKEFEKELKNYFSIEGGGDVSCEGCEIPTLWIQRLVKCRGEFRNLEPDAMSAIAEATKEFLQKLAVQSLTNPQEGLRYEDVAEIVDRTECLPFLKTLIPKKITFKEFTRLNRPKQFSSFT